MNSIWIPKLSSTLKFDLGGLDETPHALLFRQARYATVIQVMLDFGGIISNEDYCQRITTVTNFLKYIEWEMNGNSKDTDLRELIIVNTGTILKDTKYDSRLKRLVALKPTAIRIESFNFVQSAWQTIADCQGCLKHAVIDLRCTEFIKSKIEAVERRNKQSKFEELLKEKQRIESEAKLFVLGEHAYPQHHSEFSLHIIANKVKPIIKAL